MGKIEGKARDAVADGYSIVGPLAGDHIYIPQVEEGSYVTVTINVKPPITSAGQAAYEAMDPKPTLPWNDLSVGMRMDWNKSAQAAIEWAKRNP